MAVLNRMLVAAFVASVTISSLSAADRFQFESFVTLDDMRAYLTRTFPLGSDRSDVRRHFVKQGNARMHAHPQRKNIEKYVYDINLCKIYVWRWNISANYTSAGKLTQIYLNGEPIHPSGDKLRDPKAVAKPGAIQQILKVRKPRPEASKGEKVITFILYDLDKSIKQADDEFIAGAGPSRADPNNLGRMKAYAGLERWRTIFDSEPARAVVLYHGTCPTVN